MRTKGLPDPWRGAPDGRQSEAVPWLNCGPGSLLARRTRALCECRFPNNQNFYLKVRWENMLWGRGGWASDVFVRIIHFLGAILFLQPALETCTLHTTHPESSILFMYIEILYLLTPVVT